MELAGRPMSGETRTSAQVGAAGSFTESLLGAGAAVLAVLGLLGIYPFYMLTIATIGIGAALFLKGGAVAGRYRRAPVEPSPEVGAGMSAEVVVGLAGIALGILALLGVYQSILIPAAVVAFGAALVMSSESNEVISESAGRTTEERPLRVVVSSSSRLQDVAGIGALVLGILALLGVQTFLVSLVALLAIGSALFLSGTALGGRLSRVAAK